MATLGQTVTLTGRFVSLQVATHPDGHDSDSVVERGGVT